MPLVYLSRLVRIGAIERVSRGIYQPTHARIEGPNAGLVLVALRAPHAVISLLSALAYHGLTTQSSPEVWVTVGLRSRSPKLEWPLLRMTRLGGAAFTAGVERHLIDGIEVPIYSVAKTVADLFKFRSKLGRDVALEALQGAGIEAAWTSYTAWRRSVMSIASCNPMLKRCPFEQDVLQVSPVDLGRSAQRGQGAR